MKNVLITAILSCAVSATWAHQPYLAPLSFSTANAQIPVIAGFAEDALESEHALKDGTLNVLSPSKQNSTIQSKTTLKSATVFDLLLTEDGTYHVSSKVTFPIQYTRYNNEWRIFVDIPAEQAEALKDREYVIPSDFKNKQVPATETITREWLIQSYLSKNKTTPISTNSSTRLNIQFSVHPNEIKANTPFKLTVKKNNQNLKNAKISIMSQGQSEKQATELNTNALGTAEVKLPQSGAYIIAIHEKIDPKQKPTNEFYSITSISAHP